MTTDTVPNLSPPAIHRLLSREEIAARRRQRCNRHADLEVPQYILAQLADLEFRAGVIAGHGLPVLLGQNVGEATRAAEYALAHLLSHRGSGEYSAEQVTVMREVARHLQTAADCLVDQVNALDEDRYAREEGEQP